MYVCTYLHMYLCGPLSSGLSGLIGIIKEETSGRATRWCMGPHPICQQGCTWIFD